MSDKKQDFQNELTATESAVTPLIENKAKASDLSNSPDTGVVSDKLNKPAERPRSLIDKRVNFSDTSLDLDLEQGLVSVREYNSPVEQQKTGSDSVLSGEDDEDGRASWGGKLEFIFTCIGYAVGLGNVWRFPYLCYKNGGGAFLVPYIFMLALVGLPLFYMELAFGQFASLGPITIWRINPLLKGLGYAMVSVSWLIGVYYNVVISHVLLFLIETLKAIGSELPWKTCDNWWNTADCILPEYSTDEGNSTINGTVINSTLAASYDFVRENVTATVATIVNGTNKAVNGSRMTPTEEFYYNYILTKSSGIHDLGGVNWKLALCLFLAWGIVLFALIRGIQSLGKVVYFTAIFPYLVLTIMLIRGVTLPGASQGIAYYLKPDFSKLSKARVWADAATQIFFSLSACHGGLIAMSSYNKFSNNCYKDALIVSIINCCTSLYAGFVIFSVLGFMAMEKGVSVSEVAEGGPGLAFVVYPEAIARMPVSHLWAILFFIMMATLGFGSQFSIVECVLSAFTDEFSVYLREKKKSIAFRSAVCVVTFLLGLPMVTKGGIYLLNVVDYSVSGFPLLVVGFVELVALNWVYGFDNFSEDISMMLGRQPGIYWKLCWVFLSPVIIFVTIIFNCVYYAPPELKGYVYPDFAVSLSWLIGMFPICLIPLYFLYYFCKKGGYSLMRDLSQPKEDWGPTLLVNRTGPRYDPTLQEEDDDPGTEMMPLGGGSKLDDCKNVFKLVHSNFTSVQLMPAGMDQSEPSTDVVIGYNQSETSTDFPPTGSQSEASNKGNDQSETLKHPQEVVNGDAGSSVVILKHHSSPKMAPKAEMEI